MSGARSRSWLAPRSRGLSLARVLLALMLLALMLLAPPSRAEDAIIEADAVEAASDTVAQTSAEPALGGGLDPERLARALDDLTSSGAPDFCRRPNHRLERQEAALCSLAPAARARCPEFAAACERAAGLAPRPREEGPSTGDSLWLEGLAWLLKAIGLALLAGLVGLCLLALVRLVRSLWGAAARRPREPAEAAVATGTLLAEAAAPGGPEPHLARARALAARGDHARALVELHLGVVSSLDAQGVLRARPGRTNGDYARELGQRPELLAPFRELTFAVEAVQFGGARLDAGGFERWLGRAAALLPPGLPSLLPVLLASLALSLALGCGGEPGAPSRGVAEACGTGANGHSLMCQLLEASGVSVRRRYRALDELANGDSQLDVIVLLRAELEGRAVRALEAWVRGGGVLLLTAPLPELDRQLGVERSDRACGGDAAVADSSRTLVTIGPGLTASGLHAAAVCPNGDTFIGRAGLGDGWVGVVPTPAVLSNASFVAGDNALVLLSELFPPDSATVELVGSWTRDEPENPISQVRAAGLLPWVLQLMALGLCYGLYRGQPFARRRAPPEAQRRRFSEHAEALGQRWAEAGAAEAALKSYASWANEQLRERLPIGTEQTVASLAQVISEKTGKPPEAVARTLEQARQAQLAGDARPRPELPFGAPSAPRELPDEAEQLSTLKALGRLLDEIGGTR